MQVTLTRCSEDVVPGVRNYAHMIVGTIHDDAILYSEQICIDRFPSPYQVSIAPWKEMGLCVHGKFLGGTLCSLLS